jgi:uncharacterized protein YndB with AHSA1/START domain
MENENKIQVIKNLEEKTVTILRGFNAPIDLVWKAFTEKEILNQWWAPAPWKVETKILDFKMGGHWLYAMVGPEGEKHWARMNYTTIQQHEYFNFEDAFCDENGNINQKLPVATGKIAFYKTTNGVKVEFKTHYSTAEDVQKIIEMGFVQGITMTLDQLENLFNLHKA